MNIQNLKEFTDHSTFDMRTNSGCAMPGPGQWAWPVSCVVRGRLTTFPDMSWVSLWWTAPICQDVIIIMTSWQQNRTTGHLSSLCVQTICRHYHAVPRERCEDMGELLLVSTRHSNVGLLMTPFYDVRPRDTAPGPGPHQIVCANGFVRWWRWLCAAQLIRLQMSPAWHQSASRQICLIATMEIFYLKSITRN